MKALNAANLPLPETFPTLKEAYLELEAKKAADSVEEEVTPEEQTKKVHRRARDQARTTYFCAGFTKICGKPISVRLRALKKKHKLSWLCPKMSNHKFTNLGEMFNADLTGKVMEDIADEELKDKPGNCNAKTLCANGECLSGGNCRMSMCVYEDKCKITGKYYVGKTQD